MSGLCFILLCFFINAIFFLQGETLIKYYLTLPYLTYDAMQKYEEDLTNSIKRDTSRNKKLWQTIDKLRGRSTKEKLECKLYDCDEELLSKEKADTEIEEFWTNIYQKHETTLKKCGAQRPEMFIKKDSTNYNVILTLQDIKILIS